MKQIIKISMAASLLIFGVSTLEASSSTSHKVVQKGEFSNILHAKDLVQVASKLENSKSSKALELLNQAKASLEKAPESTQKQDLESEITNLQNAIKSKKDTDGMYSRTITKFDAYINKVKQWGYEIRAHEEEAADIEKFKEESKANAF